MKKKFRKQAMQVQLEVARLKLEEIKKAPPVGPNIQCLIDALEQIISVASALVREEI